MRKIGRLFLGTYLVLLAASTMVRFLTPPEAAPGGRLTTEVKEAMVGSDRSLASTGETIKLAWREWKPTGAAKDLPVLLLHGSPGNADTFHLLGAELAKRGYSTLAPDLPGFGASSHRVRDYSIRAHAAEVLDWLDQQGIDQVHVLGFSMGGGVALELFDLEPERVSSLVLLSAIGVQEMELLGSYRMNHLVHGGQLVLLSMARNLIPHFGAFDRAMLDHSYARNFYDTDQRPLRSILERFEPPILIVHGEEDFLVAAEAALEHHRLAPHSELWMRPDSHFFVFTSQKAGAVAQRLDEFFQRVANNQAPRRTDASAERLERAARPFDPSTVPPWTGPTILAVVVMLALATFASEDLACLGAGLLVAQGRLGFVPAVFGCLTGIVIGDIGLFLLGRIFGRRIARLPIFRFWLTEKRLEESSAWLRRRGPVVIGISRFTPGARLPTYVASGVLHTSLFWFSFYFLLAAALWTPIVVGLSAKLGEAALERMTDIQGRVVLVAVLMLALIVVVRRGLAPLLTRRGRATLRGRLARIRHYEFWPTWALYPPVIVYILWLGIKHRGLTLFSAVNPAIPAGGLVGESKAAILEGLKGSGSVPVWELLPPEGSADEQIHFVEAFLERHALSYPIVLKPDSGERGSEVLIARDLAQVIRYFDRPRGPTIVQRYAAGEEYGVFYYRYPTHDRGEIFSICRKNFPTVTGDGRRTVEQLVLADRRAIAIADVYLEQLDDQRSRVPEIGERVPLVEVGAHSRGTIFEEASHLTSEALVEEIDRISKSFDGFDFGRYDLRSSDEDSFRAGRNLEIIELNGVTSEATNLYSRSHSVFGAWAILFRQWKIAFEIGAQRRDGGHDPSSVGELLGMWRDERKRRVRGIRPQPDPATESNGRTVSD